MCHAEEGINLGPSTAAAKQRQKISHSTKIHNSVSMLCLSRAEGLAATKHATRPHASAYVSQADLQPACSVHANCDTYYWHRLAVKLRGLLL
jgi:hypothetical protein